ncbi:MAG: FHA domain-containing protein [Planctomycetes bacterium]|jgi:serine/threonine protein kinase/pSer/pThr/pTyr-binding forkhead associated (FHA) protein|nr:FHA domain-containing protein [Planctomycetota bacterium]
MHRLVYTHDGVGYEIRLGTDPITVGRSPGAGHRLPAHQISRYHAKFWIEHSQAWVEDLGSRNGTLRNGRRVKGKAALEAGDILTLGELEICYLRGSTGAAIEERPVPRLIYTADNGQRLEIAIRARVTIGRDQHNTLPIRSKLVSKEHCSITPEDRVYVLRDLNSSNGTFVDGERVTEAKLRHGQWIEPGKAIRIQFVDPGTSGRASANADAVNTESYSLISIAPLPAAAAAAAPSQASSLGSHSAADRYVIRAEIGAGGMGQVLLAFDQVTGRHVALKELRANLRQRASLEPEIAERFLREARVTSRLEHPGIVPVYEIGKRDDGTLFYVMRYVRGRSLAHHIRQTLPENTPDSAARMAARLKLLPHFVDMCQAIAYAHSRGVIHRDLKPDNVMLGEFGETYVLDWGLARVQGARSPDSELAMAGEAAHSALDNSSLAASLTVQGAAMGTPAYMPPEQAEGRIDLLDERSDVYSLGAVLYQLLCGHPPYDGATGHLVIQQVLSGPPLRLQARQREAPAELCAVVDKAMARSKASRFANASELAHEIQAYLDGRTLASYRYSWLEKARRFTRRRWKEISVGTLVLVLATTLVGRSLADTARRNEHELQRAVLRRDIASIVQEEASEGFLKPLAQARELARNQPDQARLALAQLRMRATTGELRVRVESRVAPLPLDTDGSERAAIIDRALEVHGVPLIRRAECWLLLCDGVLSLPQGGVASVPHLDAKGVQDLCARLKLLGRAWFTAGQQWPELRADAATELGLTFFAMGEARRALTFLEEGQGHATTNMFAPRLARLHALATGDVIADSGLRDQIRRELAAAVSDGVIHRDEAALADRIYAALGTITSHSYDKVDGGNIVPVVCPGCRVADFLCVAQYGNKTSTLHFHDLPVNGQLAPPRFTHRFGNQFEDSSWVQATRFERDGRLWYLYWFGAAQGKTGVVRLCDADGVIKHEVQAPCAATRYFQPVPVQLDADRHDEFLFGGAQTGQGIYRVDVLPDLTIRFDAINWTLGHYCTGIVRMSEDRLLAAMPLWSRFASVFMEPDRDPTGLDTFSQGQWVLTCGVHSYPRIQDSYTGSPVLFSNTRKDEIGPGVKKRRGIEPLAPGAYWLGWTGDGPTPQPLFAEPGRIPACFGKLSLINAGQGPPDCVAWGDGLVALCTPHWTSETDNRPARRGALIPMRQGQTTCFWASVPGATALAGTRSKLWLLMPGAASLSLAEVSLTSPPKPPGEGRAKLAETDARGAILRSIAELGEIATVTALIQDWANSLRTADVVASAAFLAEAGNILMETGNLTHAQDVLMRAYLSVSPSGREPLRRQLACLAALRQDFAAIQGLFPTHDDEGPELARSRQALAEFAGLRPLVTAESWRECLTLECPELAVRRDSGLLLAQTNQGPAVGIRMVPKGAFAVRIRFRPGTGELAGHTIARVRAGGGAYAEIRQSYYGAMFNLLQRNIRLTVSDSAQGSSTKHLVKFLYPDSGSLVPANPTEPSSCLDVVYSPALKLLLARGVVPDSNGQLSTGFIAVPCDLDATETIDIEFAIRPDPNELSAFHVQIDGIEAWASPTTELQPYAADGQGPVAELMRGIVSGKPTSPGDIALLSRVISNSTTGRQHLIKALSQISVRDPLTNWEVGRSIFAGVDRDTLVEAGLNPSLFVRRHCSWAQKGDRVVAINDRPVAGYESQFWLVSQGDDAQLKVLVAPADGGPQNVRIVSMRDFRDGQPFYTLGGSWPDPTEGLLVTRVEPRWKGAHMVLKPGDRLISMARGDITLASLQQLDLARSSVKISGKLPLRIRRGDAELVIDVDFSDIRFEATDGISWRRF